MTCVAVIKLILLKIILSKAQPPSVTDILPVMTELDEKTCVVDYSQSFLIPNFEMVSAVTVYTEYRSIGTATRENIDNPLKENYQKLEKNYKIKVKANPCKTHTFNVVIVFNESYSSSIKTLESVYEPNNYTQVSDICHS